MSEPQTNTMLWLLRRALGQSGAQTAEGIEPALEHSWPWPPWITLLVLILAAAYVLSIYLREGGSGSRWTKAGMILLRLGLIGIVIFMMYGFVFRPYRTDVPDIAVLVDDSASMSVEDHSADTQMRREITSRLAGAGFDELWRINQTKTLLLENESALLRQISDDFHLKVHFLSRPGPLPWDERAELEKTLRNQPAGHPSSPLGDRLRSTLESQFGRPTAAVIVFSDGVTTEGETLADVGPQSGQKGIPLYLVGLGSDRPARDVALDDLLVNDAVYVDDLVTFDLSVAALGFAGREVEVRLRDADVEEVLDRAKLTLGSDGQPERLRLRHRPREKGDYEFVVEVDQVEGESRIDNNRRQCRVSVRDEKIRVLMVQAYPSWEFRFLKNLLSRGVTDESAPRRDSIDLTVVLQEADPEYVQIDATAQRLFPATPEELFEYDVVVFGDVNPSFLSQASLQHLKSFVTERGRGAVFISGPRYTPLAYRGTPLADLLPVDLNSVTVPPSDGPIVETFVPRLTRLGQESSFVQLADSARENAALWNDLPGLYWLLEAPDLKPGVRVVAEHPERAGSAGRNMPVICLQYVGAGKVIFHGTDETWRWRRLAGDSLFGRYWLQAIRFLSRSKLSGNRSAELVSDRNRYQRGDLVKLRLRFLDDRLAPDADDGATVVLELAGRRDRQVTLHRHLSDRGIFETSLSGLTDGQYRAWLAAPALEGNPPSCSFSVTVPDSEMTRLAADFADLRQAARQSGGRFYTFATAGRLLEELPKSRRLRVESLAPVPLWNSWPIALLVVMLLAGEWLLRRRSGLL